MPIPSREVYWTRLATTLRQLIRNERFIGAAPGSIHRLNICVATLDDYENYQVWNMAQFMRDGDRDGYESAHAWATTQWKASINYVDARAQVVFAAGQDMDHDLVLDPGDLDE